METEDKHDLALNSGLRLERTNSKSKDFIELVRQLDEYLKVTDGKDHAFYDQYNKIDHIDHVVVAYGEGIAAGCGAIKPFLPNQMEIKRMYVDPEYRGQGIATSILAELELWAAELGYESCILETGINQKEAIVLYERSNYQRIENYGQYAGISTSFCYHKIVS